MLEGERLKIITQIRSLLGLTEYYKKIIKGFSQLALPLTRLTKKCQPFVWDE